MPISVLEAKLYALLLLEFAMDEAAWVAERGDELDQFLARVGALTFDRVINRLGLRNKTNRDRHTAALEVVIQSPPVPISAHGSGGVRLLGWQQMFTC